MIISCSSTHFCVILHGIGWHLLSSQRPDKSLKWKDDNLPQPQHFGITFIRISCEFAKRFCFFKSWKFKIVFGEIRKSWNHEKRYACGRRSGSASDGCRMNNKTMRRNRPGYTCLFLKGQDQYFVCGDSGDHHSTANRFVWLLPVSVWYFVVTIFELRDEIEIGAHLPSGIGIKTSRTYSHHRFAK